MDSSHLYRKLKGDDELTVFQAGQIEAFIEDHIATAPETIQGDAARQHPVFGAPADEDGERFRIGPGAELFSQPLPPGLQADAPVILVRVPGSQMEPRIFPGELVIALEGVAPAHNRDALVVFKNGTAMVKTYRGRHDGRVFLADWRDPREMHFPATQVAAVHAIIARL